MFEVPIEKMVCDSDLGDGGVYFYAEYLEWADRSNGKGFKFNYTDIKDVKVVLTTKKKITIFLNNGESYNLYLYKSDTFLENLKKRMDAASGIKIEEKDEGDLEKIERLAKLHESGALSDEEFKKAKEKILG